MLRGIRQKSAPRRAPLRSLPALVVGLMLAMGLLVACGGTSTTSPSTSSSGIAGGKGHNQDDIVFVTQLISLEEQAINLANIASAKKEDNPQVQQKAAELIRRANERITQSYAWLKEWNALNTSVPPAPGKLNEQQMLAYITATGAQFDAALAAATKSEADGMLAISRAELAAGENNAARKLAQDIQANIANELNVLTTG